jgi:hypothetical protein
MPGPIPSCLVFGAEVAKLKIGIAFPMVIPADIEGNICRIEPQVEEAARRSWSSGLDRSRHGRHD